MASIGIRKEDKNRWEARAPLTPKQVEELIEKGIDVNVETSDIRAFKDNEYEEVGAKIVTDLSDRPVVFAVKEIPIRYFNRGQTFAFFSHTIKGQDYNMPMLKELMEKECNLIDYEKITDADGKRLVFFGHYAGYAGMMDSLWAFGERLNYEGIKNAFYELKKTVDYNGLEEVKDALETLDEDIKKNGIPDGLKPLVIGFTGYGHVSQTAQELVDILPHVEISPEDIFDLDTEADVIYKVVFKEEHLVEPKSSDGKFDLQEYYDEPDKYRPIFSKYIPHLTVLMNCIYWDERYPRLVTKERLKEFYEKGKKKLRVIGDITCDVEGSIECNTKTTSTGEPVYTYDPMTGETRMGVEGDGPVVLAVDNLPCELPKESTKEFGQLLKDFVPSMASADYTVELDELELPPEIKRALVLYQGKLTPDYKYMEKYVKRSE